MICMTFTDKASSSLEKQQQLFSESDVMDDILHFFALSANMRIVLVKTILRFQIQSVFFVQTSSACIIQIIFQITILHLQHRDSIKGMI